MPTTAGDSRAQNPQIVADILGYAVTAVVLVTVVVTVLVRATVSSTMVWAATLVTGLFVAFTVTPYVVAWWVDVDVDDVLVTTAR